MPVQLPPNSNDMILKKYTSAPATTTAIAPTASLVAPTASHVAPTAFLVTPTASHVATAGAAADSVALRWSRRFNTPLRSNARTDF